MSEAVAKDDGIAGEELTLKIFYSLEYR